MWYVDGKERQRGHWHAFAETTALYSCLHWQTMITQEIKYFAPSDANLPALVLQITRLVGSYMLWIGTTDVQPENAEAAVSRGRLCQDWACSMPPTSVCQCTLSAF